MGVTFMYDMLDDGMDSFKQGAKWFKVFIQKSAQQMICRQACFAQRDRHGDPFFRSFAIRRIRRRVVTSSGANSTCWQAWQAWQEETAELDFCDTTCKVNRQETMRNPPLCYVKR
jgi:hypothetical protein